MSTNHMCKSVTPRYEFCPALTVSAGATLYCRISRNYTKVDSTFQLHLLRLHMQRVLVFGASNDGTLEDLESSRNPNPHLVPRHLQN